MVSVLAWIFLGMVALHALGFGHALHALSRTRSREGSVAWFVALITVPWLAIPAYWFFGRRHSEVYELRIQAERQTIAERIERQVFVACGSALDSALASSPGVSKTAWENRQEHPPNTERVKLFLDGPTCFDALVQAIEAAQSYVLLGYYSLEAGQVSKRILNALEICCARGVAVCVYYDEMGSQALPKRGVEALRRAGGKVCGFDMGPRQRQRLRVNFRNHRKLCVIDGQAGFIGGINLVDEYLPKDGTPGWRDTHLWFEGPAVSELQALWLRDWLWSGGPEPTLAWRQTPSRKTPGTPDVLTCGLNIIGTGPLRPEPTGAVWACNFIAQAKRFLWIATPYCIPVEPAASLLRAAAERGVDVRVLLPERADHAWMTWAGDTHIHELFGSNIRFYKYRNGFMHQKVWLSEELGAVGSMNLDARSLSLNFDALALLRGQAVLDALKDMLLADFEQARLLTRSPIPEHIWYRRLRSRVASLASPFL